jgi:tRNA (guanine37-N1)-methyltransferase|tara:strand:+ start:654 stop:1349 length:696 start_codon:yes stop_codon:yes gene_type:complete
LDDKLENNKIFKVSILTLFPEIFPGPLGVSLLGNALQNKLWELNLINIRDFAKDRHKSVDDTPYGGGAGMVMKPDVIEMALNSISDFPGQRVCLTPRGKRLSQQKVKKLSLEDGLVLLCGRYEGIDQRVIDYYNFDEISIGDYVVTGGESAAIVLLESVLRLLPNVLGGNETLKEESFSDTSLIEYPQYTKPKEWNGINVPEVLISGDHGKIKNWRNKERVKITKIRKLDT